MKFYSLLCLPFFTEAALHDRPLRLPQLKTRQLGSLLGTGSGAPKAPVSVTKLQAQYDPKAIRELVVWGPFPMLAANATRSPSLMHLDQSSDILMSGLTGICSDCLILAATANPAMRNGTTVGIGAGVYNHHIIMTDYGKRQIPNPVLPICPNTTWGPMIKGLGSGVAGMFNSVNTMLDQYTPALSVFVGGGGGTGNGLPFIQKGSDVKSGWYVSKQDTFNFLAELVNYKKNDRDVYISLDYEYLPGKSPDYLDVGMGSIAIDSCSVNSLGFYPPQDRPVSITSHEFMVTSKGYLINLTPHVHDGNMNTKILLNDKEVCSVDAIYGASGGATVVGGEKWETITGFNRDACSKPIPIKPGDMLRMSTDYDLTKHKLRPTSHDAMMGAEAMALGNFMFALQP